MARRPVDKGLSRRRAGAFSLVELLVVLGAVTILLALLLPALGEARASARFVRCADQMRGYGQSMVLYANDHNSYLVPPSSIGSPHRADLWSEPVFGADLVWEDAARTRHSRLLVCPSDPFGGDPDPRYSTRNSYLLGSRVAAGQVRYGNLTVAGVRKEAASDVVVTGEKRPDAVCWIGTAGAGYTLTVPDPQWYDLIDLVRHGARRRSNHLYLDLHVENRPYPLENNRSMPPWY